MCSGRTQSSTLGFVHLLQGDVEATAQRQGKECFGVLWSAPSPAFSSDLEHSCVFAGSHSFLRANLWIRGLPAGRGDLDRCLQFQSLAVCLCLSCDAPFMAECSLSVPHSRRDLVTSEQIRSQVPTHSRMKTVLLVPGIRTPGCRQDEARRTSEANTMQSTALCRCHCDLRQL